VAIFQNGDQNIEQCIEFGPQESNKACNLFFNFSTATMYMHTTEYAEIPNLHLKNYLTGLRHIFS
jgi:hypothetical protein